MIKVTKIFSIILDPKKTNKLNRSKILKHYLKINKRKNKILLKLRFRQVEICCHLILKKMMKKFQYKKRKFIISLS